jgi:ABC-2 type transport system ATP-binding protein
VSGVLGVPVADDAAHRLVAPLADPDRAADVLIALRNAHIGVREFTVRRPTLDEAFLVITGHAASADGSTKEEYAE